MINNKLEIKVCPRCNISKLVSDFSKSKATKDGLQSTCKQCQKVKIKEYSLKNFKKRKEYAKEYNKINREKKNEYAKKHRKQNPLSWKLSMKKWLEKNPNWEKEYRKNKYHKDINNKISHLLRNEICSSLKNNKLNRTIELLGCSIEDCRKYLESKFFPEMSWQNHGEIWEIDHIIPISKFDLTNPDQQKQCFHYTNLQPLFKTTFIAESFGYTDQIGNRNKLGKII